MKKEEIEKRLFEVRIEEIKSLDGDITRTFFTLFLGAYTILGFLYVYKVFNWLTGNILVLIASVIYLIFAFIERKAASMIYDIYNDLFVAIKKNKIREYKIRFPESSDYWCYKKRYK